MINKKLHLFDPTSYIIFIKKISIYNMILFLFIALILSRPKNLKQISLLPHGILNHLISKTREIC